MRRLGINRGRAAYYDEDVNLLLEAYNRLGYYVDVEDATMAHERLSDELFCAGWMAVHSALDADSYANWAIREGYLVELD